MYRLPTDRRAVRTSQEYKTRRDLARLARPAHIARKLVLRFMGHCRWNERRSYRPWRDGIDANASANILVRQATGEGDDSTFSRGVV